jgi:hypothetical protein
VHRGVRKSLTAGFDLPIPTPGQEANAQTAGYLDDRISNGMPKTPKSQSSQGVGDARQCWKVAAAKHSGSAFGPIGALVAIGMSGSGTAATWRGTKTKAVFDLEADLTPQMTYGCVVRGPEIGLPLMSG